MKLWKAAKPYHSYIKYSVTRRSARNCKIGFVQHPPHNLFDAWISSTGASQTFLGMSSPGGLVHKVATQLNLEVPLRIDRDTHLYVLSFVFDD